MIIRTDKLELMEEDVSDIMDLDIEYIYERLKEFYELSMDGCYLDPVKFNKMIENLVSENVNLEGVFEIYLYHLGRHFEEPKTLLPLNDVLLLDTRLSAYLKSKNIHFNEKREELELYFKGKLIPRDVIECSGCNLLACRLGYYEDKDYCINGFAFWPSIKNSPDEYFLHLQEGPEILQNLEEFLKIDLTSEYKSKTKYYGIVCKVSIQDIIFDEKDRLIGIDEKIKYYIAGCLKYLFNNRFSKDLEYNIKLSAAKMKHLVVDRCILIDEV